MKRCWTQYGFSQHLVSGNWAINNAVPWIRRQGRQVTAEFPTEWLAILIFHNLFASTLAIKQNTQIAYREHFIFSEHCAHWWQIATGCRGQANVYLSAPPSFRPVVINGPAHLTFISFLWTRSNITKSKFQEQPSSASPYFQDLIITNSHICYIYLKPMMRSETTTQAQPSKPGTQVSSTNLSIIIPSKKVEIISFL